MSRFARRVDANHSAIVDALRARGHRVQSLAALGGGVPDLIVGSRYQLHGEQPNAWHRKLLLLEVKVARNKRGDLEPLNALEAKWHREWEGWPVRVVGSVEQAISIVEGL